MKDIYNLKRVHRVNIVTIIGVCLTFIISALFTGGNPLDTFLTLIVAAISVGVYFIPMNDYVKGFIFASIPSIASVIAILLDVFAVSTHYIFFVAIGIVVIYFEEKLLVAFEIFLNVLLVTATVISFELMFSKEGTVAQMVSTFVMLNGTFVLLFFLTRWSKDIVKISEKSRQRAEKAYEELSDVNKELEASIGEVNERDSQITKMLHIDSLTGLKTRFALNEILRTKFLINQAPFTLILMNVDNFKNVNDAFGHQLGDQVLSRIGRRLERLEREAIHVARYGADEFILIAEGSTGAGDIEKLIERLHQIFEDMIIIEGNSFFLTVSIGVALYPEHGHTEEALMRCADIAVHEAKNKGKDISTIYDHTLEKDFHEKIRFQNILRSAFKNREFYLNYQPLVASKEMEIYGYEALIRWKSQELGYVSPYKLITEAEEMGLIVKIGEWIFEEAVSFIKEYNESSQTPRYISINISAVQLMYNGFVKSIIDIVEAFGVEPGWICLEMTETTLIKNLDIGGSIIRSLSDYGFKIALDDFGTGYSSLSYLKNLPIDVLKIDKSFVDHICASEYDYYLIEAVIKIAKVRNIVVVAEGVEESEQFNILKKMGCSVIQGYLFSKPLEKQDALVREISRYL